MSYKIIAIPQFEKELKRLSKKYPSIKNDLSKLASDLLIEPKQGTPIGNHCYKLRMAIASKGKGKSGGARVITCVKIVQSIVYLSTVYDKNEKDSISDKELEQLFQIIP